MIQSPGSPLKLAVCPTQPRGGKCFTLYAGIQAEKPGNDSSLIKRKALSTKNGSCSDGQCCPEEMRATGTLNKKRPVTRGKVCLGCG